VGDQALSDGLRWTEEDLTAYLKKRGRVKSDKRVEESPDDSRSMRPRKYRNQPVEFDGLKFDSAKEATVYQQLRIRQRIGEISGLERQVEFPLFAQQRATGILMVVAKYRCDFRYVEDGKSVVVDVKSDITKKNQVYQLKRAWLLAQDNIRILEV
jgi:hypothetical protein